MSRSKISLEIKNVRNLDVMRRDIRYSSDVKTAHIVICELVSEKDCQSMPVTNIYIGF